MPDLPAFLRTRRNHGRTNSRTNALSCHANQRRSLSRADLQLLSTFWCAFGFLLGGLAHAVLTHAGGR